MTTLTVAQLRIQYFRQLVGDLFILGIDELRDENPREKARKVIKLDGELLEFPIGNIPGAKPREVDVIDRAVLEHELPHLVMECLVRSSRARSGEASRL